MPGATDLSSCTTKRSYTRSSGVVVHHLCRCGPCAVCGFGPHTAIHGPALGQQPGSRPWGHEYQAEGGS